MTAVELLRRLAATVDAHDWAGLPAMLHPDFRCRLVHTGEVFDAPSWVRFNADYPGFERFLLLDQLGDGSRAAGRAEVTGRTDDGVQRFAVAQFLTVRDGLIAELVEVWTGTDEQPPPGTRVT